MPKVDRGLNIEKVEETGISENGEKDFEEVSRLLNKESEKEYEGTYILKLLNEKESLRKVFLSVVKKNPARISDITDFTFFYRQNCYPLLNNLTSLGLLKRVFVMDVVNGKEKDQIVLNDFNKWTSTMNEHTRRYYMGKTSYWRITEFGKRFVARAYKFDQQHKKK